MGTDPYYRCESRIESRRIQVSVVVPVRNEERTIQALLKSLFAQTRLPDEVITVDGGSIDQTMEVIEDFTRQGYLLKIIRADHAYPGEGRNLGVQASSHKVIAFTDAGIWLDPRWLEALCEPLERDSSVDIVYSTYEPITDTFFTRLWPSFSERWSGKTAYKQALFYKGIGCAVIS